MAHRITTQRRTLAGTDSKKSASMEASSLRKQPPQLTRPKNPDPLPIPNHKQLSKSFDSCQIQKPISQKAFYSLVGFSSDKSRREKEERKDKVACSKKKGFEEEEEENKRKNKFGALRSSVSSLSVSTNGRRRSVGGARQEVELADVFAGNGVKVVSADMPPFMQIHAVELARKVHDSAEKFTSKTLASTLKKVNLFLIFLFFIFF